MKKFTLFVVYTLFFISNSLFGAEIQLGAQQYHEYFPLLKNKRVALFSNHTGMVGNKHILDILVDNKFNVTAIFSPEHGFRGSADAGEKVWRTHGRTAGSLRKSVSGKISGGSPVGGYHFPPAYHRIYQRALQNTGKRHLFLSADV